ncbi:globin-like protein 9 [Ditylenchus destructor]|nr:globin-like protein 9 [Ditylenchus destructor]
MGNEHSTRDDNFTGGLRRPSGSSLSKRRYSVDVAGKSREQRSQQQSRKQSLTSANSSNNSHGGTQKPVDSARVNAFRSHRAKAQSSIQLLGPTSSAAATSNTPSPATSAHNSPSKSAREHKKASHRGSGPTGSVSDREKSRRMSVDQIAVHNIQQMTPSMVSNSSQGQNSDDNISSATSTPPKTRGMNRAGKMSLQGGKDEVLNNYRRFSRCSTSSAGAAEGSDGYGISLAEHLKLTSYQTLMLQQSWPRIKSNVFTNVYKQLAQKNARAKELFQKMSIVNNFNIGNNGKCCDQKEHIKVLVELFDSSIQELNAPCKIAQIKCFKIGEVHFVMCGPQASQIWDDLGDCITDAIAKTEAIRGKREAFRAWISLISFLVDSMKAGYTAQCKRKIAQNRAASQQVIVNAPGHRASLDAQVCPVRPVTAGSFNRQ